MSPASLARMLHVQFVGEVRDLLRKAPDLQVSVVRLRSAFRWLSCNSWPFMEATMRHELWDTEMLDTPFEELLSQDAASVGSTSGGVPAELTQGASRIDEACDTVLAAGPANCTQSSEADADEDDPQEIEKFMAES